MVNVVDDLGYAASLASSPRRVVSLVPSLTEAIAATCPEVLVGATDWCTHPSGLQVPRVRGTKNPNLQAIRALGPDLVVANKEENRERDVRLLRESGIPVWVTDIETVPQAFTSMRRLFTEALRVDVPDWLVTAEHEWLGPDTLATLDPAEGQTPDREWPKSQTTLDRAEGQTPDREWPKSPESEPAARVAVAIWRDPWMVVGSNTFTGDLVARLGWRNAFAEHAERYPHVELAALDREEIDVVLLPDEPYVFTEDDGPEAFTRTRTALCSGRLLTWYGPAMVGARAALVRALA